jgi:hypothetical protein
MARLPWIRRPSWFGRAWRSSGRIPVFHHIPKCGGTSLRRTFEAWWRLVLDYRQRRDNGDLDIPTPRQIGRLTPRECLVGHFDVPGYYLFERYPEVLADRRFFLFTFLRDPLDARVSLYYWQRAVTGSTKHTLERFLFKGRNYLSWRFPCDASNYREVLARYDFLGIAEESELGVQALGRIVRKPVITPPRLNVSPRDAEADRLPEAVVREFRDANTLDHLLYAEACRRWEQVKQTLPRSPSVGA